MKLGANHSRPLRKSAPSVPNIPSLDGLRGLAFLIVFLGHSPAWHPIPGGVGVDLFFFLSGFLITSLLKAEIDLFGNVDLKAFYIRRVARIVPPLIGSVGIALLLIRSRMLDDDWTPAGVASTLGFWSNYSLIDHFPATELINTINTWSLAVEEHYYLLFPGLLTLLWTRTGSLRLIVWTAGAGWFILYAFRTFLILEGEDPHRLYLSTETNVDKILAGAILALTIGQLPSITPRARSVLNHTWPLALLMFALAGSYGKAPVVGAMRPAFQAVCLTFVFWITTQRTGIILLQRGVLPLIGKLSYEAYLVHDLILHLKPIKNSAFPKPAVALLAFTTTLGTAWVLRETLGNPSRHLARRWEMSRLARAPSRTHIGGLLLQPPSPLYPLHECRSASPTRLGAQNPNE